MKPTPEQQQIIDADIGNLLVSAAAGSGKTAVLTDRVVSRVASGEADLRRLLIMTFTEKAAQEMKSRIESKLRDALAGAKDEAARRHLSRQLSYLPGTSISTIHSFCLSVIRDFGYLLRDGSDQPLLDAGFSVAADIEARVLLQQALSELMQARYEAIDEVVAGGKEPDFCQAFYHLVDGFGQARSDQPLLDLFLAQYGYLRSLPSYHDFVDAKLTELGRAAADFSQSRHAAALFEMLRLRLDRAWMVLPQLEARLQEKPSLIKDKARNEEYLKQFAAMFASLRELGRMLAAKNPDYDAIHRLGQSFQGAKFPRRGGRDPDKAAFLDAFDQHVAELIHQLSGACHTAKYKENFVFDSQPLFTIDTEKITQDLRRMLPAVTLFYQMLTELDTRYWQKKRQNGLIDFSDFEHLALKLLRLPEVQRYYQSRHDELYVDEYQDTSSIQEAVIAAIASDNCLMVGDLKQSIYRFRHARPQIFKEKARRYGKDSAQGRLIELSRNFRSLPSILAGVNELFFQLMSEGAGEIEYDQTQALESHQEEGDEKDPVWFQLLDLGQEPEQKTLDDRLQGLGRHEKEACLAAQTMHRLHDEGQTWQGMAILCRTKNLIQIAAEQLRRQGIPVLEGSDSGSFDLPELRLIEAFMQLLDNACQDIPLAAIMRCELLEEPFDERQLSDIRIFARSRQAPVKFFHEAVACYAQDGRDPALQNKIVQFQQWLQHWRERSMDMRLDELLAELYSRTYWLESLAAEKGGAAKIRVLQQFQALAARFEHSKRRGVHLFVRHLENLRQKDALDEHFPQTTDQEDGVRIMTVHGSKGLEFPVVFLIGSSYDLRPKEPGDPLLITESLGIGMDFVDPQRRLRYPSHLKLAMLEEVKAASMAEELRLFYVALTRAKRRLHVIASLDLSQNPRRLSILLQQVRRQKERKLPHHLVLAASGYLDWMLMALARSRRAQSLFEDLLGKEADSAPATTLSSAFKTEVCHWSDLAAKLAAADAGHAEIEKTPESSPAQPKDAAAPQISPSLHASLTRPYPYLQATRTPIKLSVSELKRSEQQRARREEAETEGFFAHPSQDERVAPDIKDPRGIHMTLQVTDLAKGRQDSKGKATLDAAALGTLLHRALRFIDLAAARGKPSPQAIAAQLDAMQAAGILQKEERETLRPWHEAFDQFVRSSLAKDMVEAMQDEQSAFHVEIPFTLAVPASQLYPQSDGFGRDDHGLIQGIIDCWFEKDGVITLVDYKSDRIEGDDARCARILQQRYQRQLDWYARAIEAVRQSRVQRRIIWHVPRGKAFPMPDSVD